MISASERAPTISAVPTTGDTEIIRESIPFHRDFWSVRWSGIVGAALGGLGTCEHFLPNNGILKWVEWFRNEPILLVKHVATTAAMQIVLATIGELSYSRDGEGWPFGDQEPLAHLSE